MSEERRIYARKLVNAKVLLIHPAIGEYETYTHDISNGGVFVLINKRPTLGISTQLDMRLLDSKQDDILFKMKVVRSDKTGLGLEFLGYESDGTLHNMEELRQFK